MVINTKLSQFENLNFCISKKEFNITIPKFNFLYRKKNLLMREEKNKRKFHLNRSKNGMIVKTNKANKMDKCS